MMPSLSRRLFNSPISRTVFAGLLLTNMMVAGTIAFADTNDSGTDVGSWCYLDSAHNPDADIARCIASYCHDRPTGALAAECKRKAEAQVKKMQDEQIASDDPIPVGDPNA